MQLMTGVKKCFFGLRGFEENRVLSGRRDEKVKDISLLSLLSGP